MRVTHERQRPSGPLEVPSLLALLAVALLSPSARAQSPTDESVETESPAPNNAAQAPGSATRDPEAADRLFEEAIVAMDAGDWPVACSKFEESMRLDPSVSTQLNIARCREREGRLADGWAAYNRARILNLDTDDGEKKAKYAAYIEAAIDKIEPRLPRLRLVLPNAPPDVDIAVNGTKLVGAAGGAAVPVNPGQNQLVVAASGFATVQRTIVAEEGTTQDVLIELSPEQAPVLEGAPPPSATANEAFPAVFTPYQPPPEQQPPPSWVWPVGGVGLVAIGASIAFGVSSFGARSELNDSCTDQGGTLACPSSTYSEGEVESLLDRSNTGLGVMIGLGVVGLAATTIAVVGLVSPDDGIDNVAVSADGLGWRF